MKICTVLMSCRFCSDVYVLVVRVREVLNLLVRRGLLFHDSFHCEIYVDGSTMRNLVFVLFERLLEIRKTRRVSTASLKAV